MENKFLNKNYNRIMLTLILINLVAALIVLPLLGIRDRYPFSTYGLFSFVTKERRMFTIYIVSIDGTNLEKPELSYDYFLGKDVDFLRFHDRIERVRDQYIKGGEIDVEALEESVKPLFILNKSALYHLYSVRIDKLNFYKSREILEKKYLGEFKYEK